MRSTIIHGILTVLTAACIMFFILPTYFYQINNYIDQLKTLNTEITESSKEIRKINDEYRKRYNEDFDVLTQLHEKLSDRVLRDIFSITNMLEASKLAEISKEAYRVTFNIYNSLTQVIFGTRNMHFAIPTKAKQLQFELLNEYGHNLLILLDRMNEFKQVQKRMEIRASRNTIQKDSTSTDNDTENYIMSTKESIYNIPEFQERHYYALIKAKIALYHYESSNNEKQKLLFEVEDLLDRYYKNFVNANSKYYNVENRPRGYLLLTLDDYPRDIIFESQELIDYEKSRCSSYYNYLQGSKNLVMSENYKSAKEYFKIAIAKDPAKKINNKRLRFFLPDFQLWIILEKEISSSSLNQEKRDQLQSEIIDRMRDLKRHFKEVAGLRSDCTHPYAYLLMGQFEWLPLLIEGGEEEIMSELINYYDEFSEVFNKLPASSKVEYEAHRNIVDVHLETYKIIYTGYRKTLTEIPENESARIYLKPQIKIIEGLFEIRKKWKEDPSSDEWVNNSKKLRDDILISLKEIPLGIPAGIIIQIKQDLAFLVDKDAGPFERKESLNTKKGTL